MPSAPLWICWPIQVWICALEIIDGAVCPLGSTVAPEYVNGPTPYSAVAAGQYVDAETCSAKVARSA